MKAEAEAFFAVSGSEMHACNKEATYPVHSQDPPGFRF